MRRRPLAVGGALLVAMVAVGFLMLGGDGRSGRKSRSPVSPLKSDAGELASLIEKGTKVTFHARYRATSSDPSAGGQELTMELWRHPPHQRHDVVVSASGKNARSALFVRPSQSVLCTREGEAAWTCRNVPDTQASGPEALLRQITEQAGRVSSPRDHVIAGSAVRCFVFPLAASTGEVCVTGDGIPARISSEPSSIELVELTREEPSPQVFDPPARAA